MTYTPRPLLKLGVLVVLLCLGTFAASTAHAANLVFPTSGTTVTSTPTLSWQLAWGEESDSIEMSPNPALGGGGGFANDEEKRLDFLADQQTSYTVGNSERLFAGVWFWHVHTEDVACCGSRWSEIESFRVQDERIRLSSFGVDYLTCLEEIQFDFDYSDNSRNQFARWRLDFFKRRDAGRIARRTGAVDESEFGSVYLSRPLPRRVRLGSRYFARLALIDKAGHVTRSRYRRFFAARC